MAPEPCCILLVEDEEAHAELVRRAFARHNERPDLTVAGTLTEARAYLAKSHPHLVIADLVLPDGSGTDLLPGEGAEAAYPLVVITARGGEEAAVGAMKAGALDYIVKSEQTLADMPHVAKRALRQWRQIAERKQAEERAAVYRERLRSLASELVRAEEVERRRLAAFLHDGIAQQLAMAKMRLDALRDAAASEPLAEALAGVSRLVSEAAARSRSVMLDLSPPVLHELGFVAAAEWLTEEFQSKHAIAVDFEDDGGPKPLAEEMRIALFRAVRELLVNVAKHAQTQSARVLIARDGPNLRVTVEDDGVGFEPDEIPPPRPDGGGFGLFGVRERLDYLGGRLQIDSAPRCGTRVTLTAPLEHGDLATHGGAP